MMAREVGVWVLDRGVGLWWALGIVEAWTP